MRPSSSSTSMMERSAQGSCTPATLSSGGSRKAMGVTRTSAMRIGSALPREVGAGIFDGAEGAALEMQGHGVLVDRLLALHRRLGVVLGAVLRLVAQAEGVA